MTDLNAFLPDDHPAAERAPPAEVPAGGKLNGMVPDDHPARRAEQTAEPEDRPEYFAPSSAIARASLPPDPAVQLKRYATYFGQPETDFTLHNGKVIRKVPETGTYAYVEPKGWGTGGIGDKIDRLAKWAASGAGQAIDTTIGGAGTVAGTALGAVTTGPVGAVAGGMAGGAGAESIADYARQYIDRKLAGDEETPTDWGNVVGHGALGATYTPVGKAIGFVGKKAVGPAWDWLKSKIPGFAETAGAEAPKNPLYLPDEAVAPVRDTLHAKLDEIAELYANARDAGLTPKLGQLTGSRLLQSATDVAASYPEGVERAAQEAVKQRAQIPAAVEKRASEVFPGDGSADAIEGFRTGAEKIVRQAQREQSVQARAAYAKALDDPDKTFPFTDDIKALFKRPVMKEAWANAQQRYANRTGEKMPQFVDFNAAGDPVFSKEIQPNWRAIDYLKQGLDTVVNANKDQTGKPIGIGADAAHVRGKFLSIVDPLNPEYGAARAMYGETADTVDQILKGGVGWLQKQSGPDRQNMVNNLFAAGKQSPMAKEITQIRSLYEKAGAMDEWNGALKNYVMDRFEDATKVAGKAGNVADRYYGMLWRSPQQKRVIEAAIGDPDRVRAWNDFGKVMSMMADTIPEGSRTAPRAMMAEGMQQGMASKPSRFVRMFTPRGAVEAGVDALAEKMQAVREPQVRQQIVDFLFQDADDTQVRRFLASLPAAPPRPGTIAYGRQAIALNKLLTNMGVGTGEQRLLPSPGGTERP